MKDKIQILYHQTYKKEPSPVLKIENFPESNNFIVKYDNDKIYDFLISLLPNNVIARIKNNIKERIFWIIRNFPYDIRQGSFRYPCRVCIVLKL